LLRLKSLEEHSAFVFLESVALPVHVQGPTGAWLGVLEFKRQQAPAELQLVRYYHDSMKEHLQPSSPAWINTRMACATLEVVENELRYRSYDNLASHSVLVWATSSANCGASGWEPFGSRRQSALHA
jgi:hypothetical protein